MQDFKKPDLSQNLAICSLLIKVGQFFGESTGFSANHKELFSFASFVSLFLFGVSIVLWLQSSQKQLGKVDIIADRVEEIKKELDTVDRIARYGSGGVWLARLLGADTHVHGQAGGVTLSNALLDVYTTAAEDFHRLANGNKDSIELAEYHVVDKFLLNLMRILPDGSVWLGVTRLHNSDAWSKQSAEPSYVGFQDLVERRTCAKAIQFFRMWCFDNEDDSKQVAHVLKRQGEAGLHLSVSLAKDLPDMSLVWVPKGGTRDRVGCSPDLGALFPKLVEEREYDALCAIQFKTRGGKELDGMTIYAPHSDASIALRIQFKHAWDQAQLHV